MIQRVQSLYLILAALCGLLTFVFPFAKFFDGDTRVAEYAMFGVFNLQSDALEMAAPFTFPTWIWGIASTLLPGVAIGFYKRRKKQHTVTRLAMLVFAGYVVYLLFGIARVREVLFTPETGVLYHAAFYMPVAAMVFCFLAIRGIKRDEELVRSLDRIR